ncbi:hypothetical protein J7643_04690 [bacterium]|nr:hypothetical protein [bacterium]
MSSSITGLSERNMNDLRKKANEIVGRFDTDRNGRIDKAEGEPLFDRKESTSSASRDWLTGDFVTVTTVTYDVLKGIRKGDARLADLNGDGLDADEIVGAVLREADKNGNGTLDKGFMGLFGNERLSATTGRMESKFLDTSRRETGRSSYTYYSPLPRENDRPTPPSTGGGRPTPPSSGGDYRPTPPSTGGSSRPTPPSTGGSSRPTPPSID